MRYRFALLGSVGCFILLSAIVPGIEAQGDRTQVFSGAQIIPVNGSAIPSGVLVVSKGKIVAVGTTSATTIPAGAQVIDVTGKVIMPGLVDTHSHIGGGSGGDNSGPIQPETRILDSINV